MGGGVGVKRVAEGTVGGTSGSSIGVASGLDDVAGGGIIGVIDGTVALSDGGRLFGARSSFSGSTDGEGAREPNGVIVPSCRRFESNLNSIVEFMGFLSSLGLFSDLPAHEVSDESLQLRFGFSLFGSHGSIILSLSVKRD